MASKIFRILGILVVALVAIGIMLLNFSRSSPDAYRRTQCKNNFKRLLLALHNYESTHHAFPPAHTVDADGNPLHSWRTLILPYLDQQNLYKSIDLSKPWNDPANQVAYQTSVSIFRCPGTTYPADKSDSQSQKTTYMAVVTPNSFLRSTEPREFLDIKDARSETLMIIEVMPEHAAHRMAPVDADETMVLNFGADSKRPHAAGAHCAMVDGSVRFLSANIPQDKLRALISIAGHDSVGDF